MAFPKIVWPTASANTLFFTWQQMRFAPVRKGVVRHDSIATSGVQQSVTERVDDLLVLEMEFVTQAALESDWKDFIDNALRGNPFDFYPDAGSGTFTTYILTDTEFNPVWTHNDTVGGVYRFILRSRKKI